MQRLDYTDLAVVVGPNVRWVEFDYEDLCRYAPEVLLGYRVLLMTFDQVERGGLRGRRPLKVVMLEGPGVLSHRWRRELAQVSLDLDVKFEWYRVHRAQSPVVRRLA